MNGEECKREADKNAERAACCAQEQEQAHAHGACACEAGHGHDHGHGCDCGHSHGGEGDEGEESPKRKLIRLAAGAVLLLAAVLIPAERASFLPAGKLLLFVIPYLVVGGDVLLRAVRNILHGEVFDENFLMCAATIGALATGEYLEAVAVMLFYQIGELFMDLAVDRSRKSIAALMDIKPDSAHVERGGETVKVDPASVAVDETIVIGPGERVPLDGVVLSGSSQLDTAALTGESVPRSVQAGEEIISGAVNLTGLLRVRVTKPYGASTVSRILELVENASDKKARTEGFITRFARVYTPVVCALAVLLAVVPPLLGLGAWRTWIERGLIFLVVSCPCALVLSVPLSFFGGIGGASTRGVLIKGSNFLEALARADTIVFDKTGTLTSGSFTVVAVHPEAISESEMLRLAAHAEAYSTHPAARSIETAYGQKPDLSCVGAVEEIAGHGVRATVDGKVVLAGNSALMEDNGVLSHDCHLTGTIVHVAVDGAYAGHIVIADKLKPDAKQAVSDLRALGVQRIVMLTGDKKRVAEDTAHALGVDDYHAELLPADKVSILETLLQTKPAKTTLAFVGDGINDAPVLMRADVGVAMGAMGSDAAIEAADVVLMDDKPAHVALAVRIARKTMGVVRQNIVFALVVKAATLLLAALGVANMWWAVFADVGVSLLAILNAMRCLRIKE